MQRPLTAHTHTVQAKSVMVRDVNEELSSLLASPRIATCVSSRLPDLETGLEVITELFTLQSP